jgi:hypothetical protein
LVTASFAAFYVFVHHAFVVSVIIFIPDYIVYSDNRGLHRHFPLFADLRLATDMEASPASPSDIGARLMMFPTLGRPVLATPGHAFIPDADAFPSLASSVQCLVFIGIDYFSTSALTVSPTSSLCTQFWKNRSIPSSLMCACF